MRFGSSTPQPRVWPVMNENASCRKRRLSSGVRVVRPIIRDILAYVACLIQNCTQGHRILDFPRKIIEKLKIIKRKTIKLIIH